MDANTLKNIDKTRFKDKEIGDIVGDLIPYFFFAAGSLLLIYLVVGGYSLMVSQGDPKKVQQSKSIITNALIGFAIVFFAYWIVQLLALVIGAEQITNIF